MDRFSFWVLVAVRYWSVEGIVPTHRKKRDGWGTRAFGVSWREWFGRGANAHLRRDKAAPKMGAPGLGMMETWLGMVRYPGFHVMVRGKV